MTRTFAIITLLAATLGLAACNTAAGIAKDSWAGAKYVGGKIMEDDEEV